MLVGVVVAVCVALLYARPLVFMLNYHEEYQLFLWTSDYLLSCLAVPGGVADYLSQAITQLNYLYVLGAICMGILFFGVQQLTWAVARRAGATATGYGLTFLTPCLLLTYQSDPNVLPSFAIALLAALAAMYRLEQLRQLPSYLLILGIIICLPIFYWLYGIVVYIPAIALLLRTIATRRWYIGLLAIGYTIAVIYASSFLVPYTASRLYAGLHYFRYPAAVPAVQWIVLATALIIPYLTVILSSVINRWSGAVITLFVLTAGYVTIHGAYTTPTHHLLRYDYYVRTEQWDRILTYARHHPPAMPMEVASVNLAMSQQGLLLEHLFHYYQRGSEGLFPPFSRDFFIPVTTAEVFFRLGLVNDCRRYCFEALQAIPDHQLSGRLMKRIIQCEIANGEYAVARKYLQILTHSTFYSRWAKSTLTLLDDPAAVAATATYARLRALRETHDDYLASEDELDQMTGLLLMSNPENRLAYEYLIAYELLNKDLDKFLAYYPAGQHIHYSRIPTVVQEVLVGDYLRTHRDFTEMRYTIDRSILTNTVEFINLYNANPADPRLDEKPFRHNAWHYILQSSTP